MSSTIFRRKTKQPNGAPELLFGIDIGTSYTKVAYIHRDPDSNEKTITRVIQDWSGLGAVSNDTAYLPTVLAYKKGDSLLDNRPVQVGFLTEQQRGDDELQIFEWFKESFPGNLQRTPATDSRKQPDNSESTDTMILYRHFLRELYHAIKNYTEKYHSQLEWNETRIDFMFSVPATWNRVHDMLSTITQRFQDVAIEAGFGKQPENMGLHEMFITLTEPESAAAFSLKAENDCFQDGDSVMVVDAGGGTTDICLLKIKHANRGQLNIDPLSAPTGEELGSSHIDRRFEDLATDKLKKLAFKLNVSWNITQMSHAMRYSRDFQENKLDLTSEKANGNEYFTLAIPNIDQLPQVSGVDDLVQSPNRLKFTWRELATIFDAVIDDRQVVKNGRLKTDPGIAKIIHRTRDHVIHQGTSGGTGVAGHGGRGLTRDVDIILLAGGLGQSSYLKERVTKSLKNEQNPDAFQPDVRILGEPQLCVSKGLLENRLFEIFRAQKGNANWGVVQYKALRLWKPIHLVANLANQYVDIGGKKYMRHVEWLVEQGRTIPDKSPTCTHVFEGSEQKVVEIIVSVDTKAQRFTKPGDYIAKIDCEEDGVTAAIDERTGKPYCEVELIFNIASFEVKCWSPRDPATRRLIGEYKNDFSKVMAQN